jgi:hypothetical protein
MPGDDDGYRAAVGKWAEVFGLGALALIGAR